MSEPHPKDRNVQEQRVVSTDELNQYKKAAEQKAGEVLSVAKPLLDTRVASTGTIRAASEQLVNDHRESGRDPETLEAAKRANEIATTVRQGLSRVDYSVRALRDFNPREALASFSQELQYAIEAPNLDAVNLHLATAMDLIRSRSLYLTSDNRSDYTPGRDQLSGELRSNATLAQKRRYSLLRELKKSSLPTYEAFLRKLSTLEATVKTQITVIDKSITNAGVENGRKMSELNATLDKIREAKRKLLQT